MGWYDRKVRRVRDLSCGDTRIFLELEVRRLNCRRCGAVKREQLDFVADNPFYTKRFAYYVGRRCRGTTINDVAKELALDWHTVKALEKQYMEAQLKRAGAPGPQVIGIDEIAIRKGHTYGSWSATSCVAGRSGLAARTARRRAWASSTLGSARRRVRTFGSP
jgi:transposase